ncbi:MAG: shikimate kinase [Candidatus Eisenbacteria bacterium]|uniref:Shikimate kinase n=1 Tax=Eiseniibacteriota bacterium TaxID=2212470 RepID=A0A538TTZ5_UNCEI|nr:MAG: shikimate kinase [Candidatus Eisenbacteria bacterium]
MGRAPFSLHCRGEPLVTRIALVGLPGAGKSTVAKLLARRLGCSSADVDSEIERMAGRSVPEIFDEEGEERFRDLESRALAEAMERSEPIVLSCGGGILGRASNRELLKAHARVVWLKVDPAKAAERLRTPGEVVRPLLRGGPLEERLGTLLEARREGYESAAEAGVDTDGCTPEQVADRIAMILAGTRGPWGRSAS